MVRFFCLFLPLLPLLTSSSELGNNEVDGFYLDISTSGAQRYSAPIYTSFESAALRPAELECPSDNVITTTYKCQVNHEWTDCSRSTCCPDYTYVAGRCVPDDINPCSLNLCEQKCSVFFGRVVCTCFSGYVFNREKHLSASSQTGPGPVKVCEDVDECLANNGDCDQICTNEEGSHKCSCKPGFRLNPDNQTCTDDNQPAIRAPDDTISLSSDNSCTMGCGAFIKLKQSFNELSEMVRSLNTAIKLYSFAAGPPGAPGPSGPPGPPGPTGPRGFPGSSVGLANYGEAYQHPQTLSSNDEDEEGLDSDDDILDSFKMIKKNGKKHFCKCKRGPVGLPGAPGIEGPRGPKGDQGVTGLKGEAGSFDFFMLMMADLRHDLEQLQSRVFPSPSDRQNLPRYNMQQHLAWEKRMREKQVNSVAFSDNLVSNSD